MTEKIQIITTKPTGHINSELFPDGGGLGFTTSAESDLSRLEVTAVKRGNQLTVTVDGELSDKTKNNLINLIKV